MLLMRRMCVWCLEALVLLLLSVGAELQTMFLPVRQNVFILSQR